MTYRITGGIHAAGNPKSATNLQIAYAHEKPLRVTIAVTGPGLPGHPEKTVKDDSKNEPDDQSTPATKTVSLTQRI